MYISQTVYVSHNITTQQSFFFYKSPGKSKSFFISNLIPLVNNITVQHSRNKIIANAFNLENEHIYQAGYNTN